MTAEPLRIPANTLRDLLQQRLEEAGLAAAHAHATAHVLTEADLLGHRTHGAAMLPLYLDCLRDGWMASGGDPDVLSHRGASALWNGRRIAGAWLVGRAIETAEAMARDHGTGTVVIRRSFHIGCLAAYLEAVAQRGLVLILQTSAPHAATVAPHGGTTPVLSPNPIAVGYPTSGLPVLIDVSTSVTSNSLVREVARDGGRLPHPWVITAEGEATDDPSASEVILPLGGLDAGHKGFAMGLMVEALTAGLAAVPRTPEAPKLGGTVFVQVLDPEAFGGLDAMSDVMGDVSALCHASAPADPANPVRLPGEAGLRRKTEQLQNGVLIDAALWSRINV